MSGKYLRLAIVAGLTIALDQLTKIVVRQNIPETARPIEVIPNLLNIVHAENRGAAWSMLADAEWRIPFFLVTTVIALVVILVTYHKLTPQDKLTAFGLSFIFGGAIGNFIDRMVFGSVTDFVQMYAGFEPLKGLLLSVVGSIYWPVYNVADVAIVVGVGMVLYQGYMTQPEANEETALGGQPS